MEVDRRTVDKYIKGYTKPKTRNCNDCITPFYGIIAELLSDRNQQVFYYRKVLWQYLVDNHGFTGVYCNFCHYLRNYPEFDSYFRKSRPSNNDKVTIRYETPMGKQAQLDWKESIPFILSSGETTEAEYADRVKAVFKSVHIFIYSDVEADVSVIRAKFNEWRKRL